MNQFGKFLLITACLSTGSFLAKAHEDCDALSTPLGITASSTIDDVRNELRKLNIPVFEFNMTDGEFPSYTVIEAPEGCIGKGITDNNWVEGILKISVGDEILYESGEYVNKESGIRLKCRGNTSTAQTYIQKKSYKLKLQKKADLLFRDDKDLKDKDWVLLGNGSARLQYAAGTELARICGMPWEPSGKHVAVIMNDKYMGTYYLVEAVKGDKNRVNIEDTGYIIENDAYWWKPGEVYFKSEYLPKYMGWTFTEPDTDDFADDTLDNIKNVISIFEDELFAGNDVSDMLDYETFASWLLSHDIMNTIDAMGCNMFVVKENFNADNLFETKLKMGPVWDFDDCFKHHTEKHAPIYDTNGFWYIELTKRGAFREIYMNKWLEVKDNLSTMLYDKIKTYAQENHDLHRARLIEEKFRLNGYTTITCPLDDTEDYLEWLETRLETLNDIMEVEYPGTGVDNIEIENFGNEVIYNLMGVPVDSSYKGIVIKKGADGKARKFIQK